MDGHPGDSLRQLIHIPLIHTPADMGSMAQGLEAVYIDRFGRQRWQEQVALADRFWRTVRGGLDGLHLDYTRVDLYQDGLPVCGKEIEIVRAAAGQGSENHQLLVDLMARGATLVGTEDVALLLEEYQDLRAALGRGGAEVGANVGVVVRARDGTEPPPAQCRGFAEEGGRRIEGGPSSLEGDPGGFPGRGRAAPARHLERLAARDAFIARRIGQTLRVGRIGVLLLGMAHAIESHLPGDIVVSRLHLSAL